MKKDIKSNRRPLTQIFSTLLLATVFLFFAGTAQKISAQLVTDFNFDSLTVGSPLPTTAPGVDSYPQHTVYSVGGFPNDADPSISNPLTGSVTVQNVGALSKAALMSTTQAGTGALYIDTQMLASGPTLSLSFDIDVVNVPTTGLPRGAWERRTGRPLPSKYLGWIPNGSFASPSRRRAARVAISVTACLD